MQKNIAVRFIKPKPPYNAGEVAGFPKSIVTDLIRKNIAVLFNPGEIEIQPEPDQENRAPMRSALSIILDGTKSDIEKTIKEKDDEGLLILSDSDLGNMLAEERNGKARKGVIKAIEGEAFGRLNE